MKRFIDFIRENTTTTLKLYYSDKFRELLNKIKESSSLDARKVAEFLLLSEDSNQMLDKHTLIDITDKNDQVSHIQVNRIFKELPINSNIGSINKDSEFWTNDKIRTKHKIGKWVNHIYKDVYKTTNYSSKDIEEFTNVYKATYDGLTGPNFVILKGEEIKWGYLHKNYAEGSGTLANSCMRYTSCQEYFEIYSKNTEVCSLLVLKDDNNKVKGRALLWKLDDGDNYIDRVYTANDSDKYIFSDWSIKNNYRQYDKDNNTKKVTLNESTYEYYPYMDTFIVLDTDEGVLTDDEDLNGEEYIKLQSTSGGYHKLNGVWSDREDRYIDEDEAVYVESIDGYVHQDNAVYLEYKDIYEADSNDVVHSDCSDDWLYREDAAYSEILDDYVNVYDGDYVSFIINKDEDVDVVPSGPLYSHLYIEVDSIEYSTDYVINPYTGNYEFLDDIFYDIKTELVSEFGDVKEKVYSDLDNLLLEFKCNSELEKYITDNEIYKDIMRTYFGYIVGKPTPEEMLPIIYTGALIEIDTSSTIRWPRDKYIDKLNAILNKINNVDLSNKYRIWTQSNAMYKKLLQFAFGFRYDLLGDDIYKRILYNRTLGN